VKIVFSLLLFFAVVVSGSSALHIGQDINSPQTFEIPDAPQDTNIFTFVINIVKYFFGSIATFTGLLTNRVEGIPVEISTLLLIPILLSFGWLGLRLLRGGG
jgi:hypothetical protein